MIVKIFDYGWGSEWPIKQIENQILDRYLAPCQQSDVATVIINSTWYSQKNHESTMSWLRQSRWDQLILVAMIDAAIPNPQWYQEFDRPVAKVGSWPGPDEIVFWAEVAHRYIWDQTIDPPDFDRSFMCLNRKPHWHRRRLYQQLESKALLDHGMVSMGSEQGPALRSVDVVSSLPLAPNNNDHGIANDIITLGDRKNWSRCFLNIVTESIYDVDRHWFVSEKIFKPIIGLRPFLVYAQNGAKLWLEQHGFQNYFDDFRDISDLDLSQPDNVPGFLEVLSGQGKDYWKKKYLDLLPKIHYNKQRFDDLVRSQHTKINQGIKCQI